MPDDLVLDDVSKDTLDILNEAGDKKEKDDIDKDSKVDDDKEKEDDKDESSDDEEKDEIKLDDDEEDEEVPGEDEDEESEIFSNVPSRKEVLKAYPDLYKKFPALEKAVYREQQYAEVFPTVKDARAVREELGNFKQLESSLLEGNAELLFDNLKKNAPDSFEKIAGNLLGTLKEVDEKAYNSTITQVIKGTLINAFNYAKENGDENLEKAVQILHRAIYGSAKVTPFASDKISDDKPKEKKDTKLDEERRQFNFERYQVAEAEVGDKLINRIKSAIDKHIDPKESMTDYVRDKAKNDVEKIVQQAIMGDRRLRMYIDRLWKDCIEGGYRQSDKDKILNVLTTKARNVLPSALNKVRAEALKNSRRREREDNEEAPISRGRNVDHRDADNKGRNSKTNKLSELSKTGASTLDILNAVGK